MQHGSLAGFLEQFRAHFYTFQTRIPLLRKEQRFEELRWRGNQLRLMQQMLEIYQPQQQLAGEGLQQLDLFSGFYALNTMLVQIARKQEFAAVKAQVGEEMASLTARAYNLVGRDPVLQDARDPLGASNNKSGSEQKALLEKYKLFVESRCDVDSVVFDFA